LNHFFKDLLKNILLKGTTWVSEMLWLIMNDCDFEKAAQIPLLQRAFFPE